MKNILFVLALLLFASSSVFAQVTNDAIPLNGTIIDCNSAVQHKDDLNNFVSSYTKEDALQPSAVTSGYGLFTTDNYMKFDNESNSKIIEYLNKPDSKLGVSVKVLIEENNILSLVSVDNQ